MCMRHLFARNACNLHDVDRLAGRDITWSLALRRSLGTGLSKDGAVVQNTGVGRVAFLTVLTFWARTLTRRPFLELRFAAYFFAWFTVSLGGWWSPGRELISREGREVECPKHRAGEGAKCTLELEYRVPLFSFWQIWPDIYIYIFVSDETGAPLGCFSSLQQRDLR